MKCNFRLWILATRLFFSARDSLWAFARSLVPESPDDYPTDDEVDRQIRSIPAHYALPTVPANITFMACASATQGT